MEKWEIALDKFLIPWRKNKEVVGALVCGSFVMGNPTKHSDIDLHIALSEKAKWRERGNKIVNGFLIEYFANPAGQIIEYFKEDYNNGKQMAVIQFITGRIIFDDGSIKQLKKEAEKWRSKQIVKSSKINNELNKYAIWDMLDNLQDSFDKKDASFWFVYHNFIAGLIQHYCKFVGYPAIKDYRALDIFTKEKTRKKYLLPEFPDKVFSNLIVKAFIANDKDVAMLIYKKISQHLLKQMGGFNINGWKIKSPVLH